MKHSRVILLLLAMACSLSAQTTEIYQYNSPETQASLQWYRDAKFGMFIHFGAYSLFEEKPAWWRLRKAQRERLKGTDRELWDKEYRATAMTFSADRFDAKAIVALAKDAGMKWITIGAKHHDGFAIYPSEHGGFSTSETSFKRDMFRELKEACDEAGIRLGFYYSHYQDWDYKESQLFPYGFTLLHDLATPDKVEAFNSYCETKAYPQIRELMTRYEPFIIWYDTPGPIPLENARMFRKIVKDHDRSTLVCNRIGRLLGDYDSFPDGVVSEIPLALSWETCMISSGGWAYKPSAEDPLKGKSCVELIKNLCKICSNGGVFLLNLGPKSDGSIPGYYPVVWREVGRWVKKHAEAIYGTQANPLAAAWPNLYCTTKDNKLYLFIPNQKQFEADGAYEITGEKIASGSHRMETWSRPEVVDLSHLRNEIKKVHFLSSGTEVPIDKKNGATLVCLPKAEDAICDVLVVETAGAVEVEDRSLPQADERGVITILPKDLYVSLPAGKRKKFEAISVPDDDRDCTIVSLSWYMKTFASFMVDQAGEYDLEVVLKTPEYALDDLIVRINGRYGNIADVPISNRKSTRVVKGFNLTKGVNSLVLSTGSGNRDLTKYILIKSIRLRRKP